MNLLEGSIPVRPHKADGVACCNAVPCNFKYIDMSTYSLFDTHFPNLANLGRNVPN